jgi:ribosomal protein S12 methylthiotransferase
VAIRTTFLVGHPGEEIEDFNELIAFVDNYKLDRVGVFTYSEEEGTYAQQYLTDTIPQAEKERRATQLMELQRNISLMINQSRVGSMLRVMVDSVEEEAIFCRTEYDSPEVDQNVIIHRSGSSQNVNPGEFVNVKIVEADDYDLIGELN